MIYMFLADGFEEIEALATLDVLRRGGVEVCTVGVQNEYVRGTHDIVVKADKVCEEIDYKLIDGVILPGGMPGTVNLENSNTVQSVLDAAYEQNKLICAICAAPLILGHKGFLEGKEAVCFPGFEKELYGAAISDEKVVEDGNIITAIGAGASLEFGFKILARIKGEKTSNELKTLMKA